MPRLAALKVFINKTGNTLKLFKEQGNKLRQLAYNNEGKLISETTKTQMKLANGETKTIKEVCDVSFKDHLGPKNMSIPSFVRTRATVVKAPNVKPTEMTTLKNLGDPSYKVAGKEGTAVTPLQTIDSIVLNSKTGVEKFVGQEYRFGNFHKLY